MNKLTSFFVMVLLILCGYVFYRAQIAPEAYLVQDDSILAEASETTSFGRRITDRFVVDTISWSVLRAHLVGPVKDHVVPLEILESNLEIEFWKIVAFDLEFAYNPKLEDSYALQEFLEATKRIVFPRLTRAHASFHLVKTHEISSWIILDGELSIAWHTRRAYIVTQVSRDEAEVLSLNFSFVVDRRERGLDDLAGYFNNYIVIEGLIRAQR